MAITKGQLKDKLGNILHPETSFSQVLAADNKSLETWRSEIDAVVPTTAEKAYLTNAGNAGGVVVLDSQGLISEDKLPAIVRKFKGSYANAEALPATGAAGDYAICTDTDTVWIWDEEKAEGAGWIDTGKKGSVTSVNGQTGEVTITLETLGVTLTAETINGLPTAVETAQAQADKGVADAAAAKTAADAAQGTADGAQAAAEAAQTTADQGVADAATAQAAAEAAQAAADAAQAQANKVDFAIVDNGAAAPENLNEGGMYFEKAAAVAG